MELIQEQANAQNPISDMSAKNEERDTDKDKRKSGLQHKDFDCAKKGNGKFK